MERALSHKNRQCLIVLGMHRSGTSALAGVLQLLGVDLGKELMMPQPDNPKGFFENIRIHQINETLLESLHSSWDDLFPFPENWWQQEALSCYKQEILETVQSEFDRSQLFGIKDPRLCLLLPFWQQIFEELPVTFSYLIVVRNPLEIAASLAHRDHFSVEKSGILWMNSMLHAELYTRNHSRVFIAFDNLLNDPLKTLETISDGLEITFPYTFEKVEQRIRKFLSPDLKHHNIQANVINKELLSFLSKYYTILQNFARTSDISRKELAKINRLRKEFYQVSRWFYNEDIRDTLHVPRAKEDLLREKAETYKYISEKQSALIKLKETEIQQHIQALHTKNTSLQQQTEQLQNKEAELQQHRQSLGIKDAELQQQVQMLQAKDAELRQQTQMLQAKDAELRQQAQMLQAKDAELRQQTQMFQTKDAELQQQTEMLRRKEAELQHQALFIQAMRKTWSWKITAPLRTLWNVVRFVMGLLVSPPKILNKASFKVQKADTIIVHVDEVKLHPDKLSVTGWALAQKGVEKIEIYRDDHLVGNASYGDSRPDVASAYPDMAGICLVGFTFAAALPDVPYDREEHTIVIRAGDLQGHQTEKIKTLRMTPRILSFCDTVELYFDALIVSGWVLSDGGIKSIEVYVDDHFVGNAEYGLERQDVEHTYPLISNSRYSGFYLRTTSENLPELQEGDHRIIVKAINTHGQISKMENTSIIRDRVKEECIKLARLKLDAFLETEDVIRFSEFAEPLLTIILILFNRSELAFQCLESIKAHADVPYEIIILDNASTDDTSSLLKKLDNVTILKNPENVGFLKACNQAVEYAHGKYLVLLNSDTQVLPHTFSSLVNTINSDPKIGVVGGKLIFPDGKLQEAGNIIWQDGSCLGYGRGDDPDKPEYSYLREVYYCSGALLLTPRLLFRKLGKFDERYAPAYYEEVDYCMNVWEKGYKVVYQPLAQIIHYEFASSRKSDEAVQLQIVNKETLRKKWATTLAKYYEPHKRNIIFAREFMGHKQTKRIVFIDDRIPDPKLGSGLQRSVDILNTLTELGYRVTFFPLQILENSASMTQYFQQRGVEVMYAHTGMEDKLNLQGFLQSRRYYYDILLISRPHNMQEILPFRDIVDDHAKVVYDCEALFALREYLYMNLRGQTTSEKDKEKLITKEIDLVKHADSVITVSVKEKRIFEEYGIPDLHVVGFTMNVDPTPNTFDDRQDILFVGAIHASPNPNEDAILHFTKHIYPVVYEKTKAKLFIMGTNESKAIWNLRSPHIIVTGQVEHLFEYYNTCRMFVVPTRYAAGIPYKLYEASAHGIPSVVTPLVAEQIGRQEEKSFLIGYDADDFARKCINLYTNTTLWETIRSGTLTMVTEDCSHRVFKANLYNALEEEST